MTWPLSFMKMVVFLLKKKLVMSHMRFVAFIAHGYKGYGLEQADLIQEGTIGLMKAVKRFNPHKKVRLSSFAVYWIRAKFMSIFSKTGKLLRLQLQKHKENFSLSLSKQNQIFFSR